MLLQQPQRQPAGLRNTHKHLVSVHATAQQAQPLEALVCFPCCWHRDHPPANCLNCLWRILARQDRLQHISIARKSYLRCLTSFASVLKRLGGTAPHLQEAIVQRAVMPR